MEYKVIYHVGESVGLKTKGDVGRLTLSQEGLRIEGTSPVWVPRDCLSTVELFRQHGTGRMLKVSHKNGTLFVSAVRFTLFGLFAYVNFVKTGKLKRAIEALIANPDDPDGPVSEQPTAAEKQLKLLSRITTGVLIVVVVGALYERYVLGENSLGPYIPIVVLAFVGTRIASRWTEGRP